MLLNFIEIETLCQKMTRLHENPHQDGSRVGGWAWCSVPGVVGAGGCCGETFRTEAVLRATPSSDGSSAKNS